MTMHIPCNACREAYERNLQSARHHVQSEQNEVARLRALIAAAMVALNDGRRGDLRKILTTGNAAPLKAVTGVIARDGGGP